MMKRFTPSMCQEPSSCLMALVRPAPTSEPASGSVSTMVAPQPRSAAITAHFFCSSVPMSWKICAKPAPMAYMYTAGLAPRIVLAERPHSARGIGMPPSSSARPTLSQPPSSSARTDFLKRRAA